MTRNGSCGLYATRRNIGESQMKTEAVLNVFRKAYHNNKGVNLQELTKVFDCRRRLYDITTILTAIGLIEKVRIPSNKKASGSKIVYIWKGVDHLSKIFETYDEEIFRNNDGLDIVLENLPFPLHPQMKPIENTNQYLDLQEDQSTLMDEEEKERVIVTIQNEEPVSPGLEEWSPPPEEDPPLVSYLSPMRVEDPFQIRELSEGYFIESDLTAEFNPNLPPLEDKFCWYCGLEGHNAWECYRVSS